MQLTLTLLTEYEARVADSPLIYVIVPGRYSNRMRVHSFDWKTRWPSARLDKA